MTPKKNANRGPAKKGKSWRKSFPNRYKKTPDAELVAQQDFAADLEQFADDRGFTHFRQTSAINEYNPEGITLAAVELGLVRVFRGDLVKSAAYEEREPGISTSMPKQNDAPDTEQDEGPFWSDDDLVQAGDKKMAELMRDAPIAMVARRDFMMTVGRWCYAAWRARSPAARKHGQEMLSIIRPKTKARPAITPFTDESIAAAYRDLEQYARGLTRCIKKAIDAGADTINGVLKYYPDCLVLEALDIPISTIFSKNYQVTQPANIAKIVLRRWTGQSRTTLMARVKNAE